jgi:OmpA-OmpF porin, OOP family
VEEPEEIVVEVDEEAGRVELREMILFETGSAEILPQSYPLLNQIARVLNENPQVELVRIEGHTDNQGGAAYNLDLSQRRAESVRTSLIERGVDEDRLLAEGFGLTRPVADNATEEGRADNRRVEMHILDAETAAEREGEQESDEEEVEEAE